MKILICEDDPIVVKVIQVAVAEEKADVHYAKDGRVALELLRQQDFDLIITDIHMPYHNGDEVLQLVRGEQKKKTPIIMISSDDEEEVIKLALKLGVNEFIDKPLQAEVLRKKIRKYLPAGTH
jgi:DNA-binding response OmpR family regulator